jgi:hypothetical protein
MEKKGYIIGILSVVALATILVVVYQASVINDLRSQNNSANHQTSGVTKTAMVGGVMTSWEDGDIENRIIFGGAFCEDVGNRYSWHITFISETQESNGTIYCYPMNFNYDIDGKTFQLNGVAIRVDHLTEFTVTYSSNP